MLMESTKRIALLLLFGMASIMDSVQTQGAQTPISTKNRTEDQARHSMMRRNQMEGETRRTPRHNPEGIMMLDFIQKEVQRYTEEQRALREEIITIMMKAREKTKEVRDQDRETDKEIDRNSIHREAEEEIRVVIAKMLEASAAYHTHLASLLRENKEKAVDRIVETIKERGNRRLQERVEGRKSERNPDRDSQDNRKTNSAQDSEEVF